MRLIDLEHLGVARTVAVWQVDDVLVDCGPTSCVQRLLAELDGWRPRTLLLTHIHLDHAGAAGVLAREWPETEIYVHTRGARHLVDPSRLNDSVRRLYGERTDALWGAVMPVSEERLRPLNGGEQVGGFRVAYTPGHASHHVSFLHDSGTAFPGDVAGVRIVPASPVLPHAPPPDIDLEAWDTSLETLREWHPSALALPHFGLVENVGDHLEQMSEGLHAAERFARVHSADEFVARTERKLESLDAQTVAAYRLVAPPAHSHMGFVRYSQKRSESRPPEAATLD